MSNSRISKKANNKVGTYDLVRGPFPYHAREDNTTLGGNYLISPSKNVINNTANRLQVVGGYELDGGSSSVIDSGILSSFDFYPVKTSSVRNMRAGFLTSAGNDGKLQFRYVDANDTVSWINLKTSLTTVRMCFAGEYWDNTEKLKLLLWVDGSNNVYEWNGAVTTVASATATTLTKQGTETWAQAGFYSTRDKTIVINGVTATYTGGEATTTLTGVSVDFSATPAGSEVHQASVTTALSSMTSISATFGPTVIGCGRQNQVYLGSSVSNDVYVSKVNDFTDYAFSSPVRTAGEGFILTLDDPAVKFIPQEVHGDQYSYDMWISMGKDRWSIVRSTLSADNADERLELIRLKSAPLQGAQSERLCSKMKNQIIFVGNDNVVNAMGYISYQYVPVMQDLSYTIIDDQNSYDMTDGSIFYYKNYIYEAIPRHGLIRIYNMTNQTEQNQPSSYTPTEQLDAKQPFFWEAPIGYPVTGFYIVDGEVYGHSYTTSESYKLFTGGSFNGQDIDANATLAYDDKGDRTQSKGSDEIWVEGYIKQNTVLNCTIKEDLNAFENSQTVTIDGTDNSIVSYGGGGNSLGDTALGKQTLGGSQSISPILPAWFHVAKTYPQNSYYLESISFYTKGIDLDWQLITWGTNAQFTAEGNNSITQ
jgi:hypothetical protein